MGDVVENVVREVGKFASSDLGQIITVGAALALTVIPVTSPLGMALLGASVTLSLSAAYYQQQQAKKALKALSKLGQSPTGHLVNTRAAQTPVPIIYGTCRVGGNIIFLKTDGQNNKDLWMVMTLGEGRIEVGNAAIYVNGKPVYKYTRKSNAEWKLEMRVSPQAGRVFSKVDIEYKVSDAYGNYWWKPKTYQTSAFDGFPPTIDNRLNVNFTNNILTVSAIDPSETRIKNVRVYAFSGDVIGYTTVAEAYTGLFDWAIDNGAGGISGNSQIVTDILNRGFVKPKGVALLYVKATYKDGVWQGLPSITLVLDGKNDIYDPRDGTQKFTANPALILLDYMTSPRYGFGIPLSRIDTQSFSDAANYCDNMGFIYNGVVTDGRGMDIIEHILQHFRGYLQYSSGKFSLRIRDLNQETPVASITEDDIIEGTFTLNMPDIATIPNAVQVNFLNPEQEWKVDSLLLEDVSVSSTEDRREMSLDLYGADPTQAKLLGAYYLERARLNHTVSFTTSPEFFALELGDVFYLYFSDYGINGVLYRVIELTPTPDGYCRITALIEDAALYNARVDLDIYDLDITNLPDPTTVFVLNASDILLEEVLAKGNDDRLRSWLKATFTELDFVSSYELWLKGSTWSEWRLYGSFQSSPIQVPDLVEDTYEVKIVPVSIFGAKDFDGSPTLSITIRGKYYPPPDVATFSITPQPFGDLLLEWGAVQDLDLVGYEIREGSSWDTGSVVITNYSGTSLVLDATGKSGTVYFGIKAIDGVGNYSSNPNIQSYTIQPPGAVQNLRLEVIDNNVLIRFDPPPPSTFFIEYYEVRKGADWATAEVLGAISNTFHVVFEQQSGEYTYWVAAVDYAGNYGTPVSATAQVSEPPDFRLIDRPSLTWNGGKTNAFKDSADLLIPVNATETWDEHFVNNGMNSIQDFINAGYTYWVEPVPLTGSYEEQFDAGTTVGSAKITVNLLRQQFGNPSNITPTISVSADGNTWTDYVGYWSVYATNFRHYKVKFDVSSPDSSSFLMFQNGSSLDLNLKRKSDEGVGTVTDANAGASVTFNTSFIDVESITVTPQGTTPLIPVVDFTDTPYPTGFTVYLFDEAGNKVTGSFYWQARGV